MTDHDTADSTDEHMTTPDTVLSRLHPSAPRRMVGAVVLAALGGMLLYLALWYPPASLLWRVFLLGFSGLTLFGTLRMWHSTAVALELTALELRETTGRRLALVADMRDVSRGAFAFKPSNGFLLSLHKPGARVWAPGLWWRIGRRIGIGGVTASHEARHMAETITGLIAARGKDDG
ncbi:MAG: hypothetical protein U1D06_13405 [Paracoccaceae bacterium]|nr:hypothetical protein [Paracoccaceae bacterium]